MRAEESIGMRRMDGGVYGSLSGTKTNRKSSKTNIFNAIFSPIIHNAYICIEIQNTTNYISSLALINIEFYFSSSLRNAAHVNLYAFCGMSFPVGIIS